MLIYTALSRSKEAKPITSCKRNPGSASHRKRQDDCGLMTWSQCNSLLPAHRQLFSTKHLSQFKFFPPPRTCVRAYVHKGIQRHKPVCYDGARPVWDETANRCDVPWVTKGGHVERP